MTKKNLREYEADARDATKMIDESQNEVKGEMRTRWWTLNMIS
jgi:hypothetical protein